MGAPQPEDGPAVGRRERKKARTRAAIQHEALRLFGEKGYDRTTMEEIAEAADVSASTLFRHFASKEALVLTDEFDPLIIDACRSQPAELGAVEAIRRGIRDVFEHVSEEALADIRVRAELAVSVPDLRGAMLDQLAQAIRDLTGVVAERAGRPSDDFAVATLAGAIMGVMLSAELYWVEHPRSDLFALLDDALVLLETGLTM
ncbi:MAG TPA: TetR family transcriptional regulator [Acidimicrobiales bacterium]|nr:TetR family transcriptional regulator [Acidimicrobiales bacterium]